MHKLLRNKKLGSTKHELSFLSPRPQVLPGEPKTLERSFLESTNPQA